MVWADALNWHYWVHSVVGGAHVISAIIALIVGPLIFFTPKGARFHRIAGYIFVVAVLTANITALTLYDLSGRPNLFHFLALVSLFSVMAGFYLLQRAVRLRSERLLREHARLMMWTYFGLAGAGYAQILSRLLVSHLGNVGQAFMIVGGSIGVAGVICSFAFRYVAQWLAGRYPFE